MRKGRKTTNDNTWQIAMVAVTVPMMLKWMMLLLFLKKRKRPLGAEQLSS